MKERRAVGKLAPDQAARRDHTADRPPIPCTGRTDIRMRTQPKARENSATNTRSTVRSTSRRAAQSRRMAGRRRRIVAIHKMRDARLGGTRFHADRQQSVAPWLDLDHLRRRGRRRSGRIASGTVTLARHVRQPDILRFVAGGLKTRPRKHDRQVPVTRPRHVMQVITATRVDRTSIQRAPQRGGRKKQPANVQTR